MLVLFTHNRRQVLVFVSGHLKHDFWMLVRRIRVNPTRGRFYKSLLALDGGGLRLHMTNQILKELEHQIKVYLIDHPEHLPDDAGEVTSPDQLEVQLADYFTCFAGVSAGSWVTLYYASKGGNGAAANFLNKPDVVSKYGDFYPGSAAGLDVFFEEYGKKIYPPGFYGLQTPRFSFGAGRFSVDIPGVNSPLYPVDGLEEALKVFYGDTKLSEMHTSIIVHAYDVRHRNPVLFSYNHEAKQPYTAATVVQSRDALVLYSAGAVERSRESSREGRYLDVQQEDFYIRDIARASSALPGFHDAKKIHPVNDAEKDYLCVDGGLVSPNPTMHAVNFILRMTRLVDINRIATLSLGAGGVIGDFSESVGRGARWLLSGDLISIVYDGGNEAVQSNLFYLFYEQLRFDRGQFLRIQVFAQRHSEYAEALNSVTHVQHLKALKNVGQMTAEQYKDDIKDFVAKFLFSPKSSEPETMQTT